MQLNDYFDLIGQIGLITTGSIVGALITVFITHFFEKSKLKTERQSNLQREIYFKLQQQAEKIFEQINLINRQVEDMMFWLQKGVFELKITNTSTLDKIEKMSSFQPYFSKEILKKYNETVLIFREILKIYFETGKTGDLDGNKVNELIKTFKIQSNELVRDVLAEIERNKNLIV